MVAQMRLLSELTITERTPSPAPSAAASPEADHTAAPKTLDEPRPLTLPRIHAPGGAADALRGS